MLMAGMQGCQEILVTKEKTAIFYGSGTLEVFATPAMAALMEETAWKSVAGELEEGYATVGTSLAIKHLSATPVGMKVTCHTVLKEVDGRRLVFEVTAEDEAGKIGEGTHERFLINSKQFQEKADKKR